MTWPPQSSEYEPWPQPQGAQPWQGWGEGAYTPGGQSLVERLDVRKDFIAALVIAVAIALAGVAAGFAWHATSARPRFVVSKTGAITFPANDDKNYFGAESAFLAIAAMSGVIAGGVVWGATRGRGPSIPAALALGSIAAGLIMRKVGEAQVTDQGLARSCGVDKGLAGICRIYDGHLELRVAGLTLLWAITALALYSTLYALSTRERRHSTDVDSPGWPPVP
ncbi:MAG: hypothetical protein ABIM89_10500 [Mycobacteriales bacterium]